MPAQSSPVDPSGRGSAKNCHKCVILSLTNGTSSSLSLHALLATTGPLLEEVEWGQVEQRE